MNRDEILNYLKLYKNEHKEHYFIDKLGIFGSFARGEATSSSDLDVVVGFTKPNLLTQSTIMLDLKKHFNIDVDVVALWDKMNPRLKKRIDADAIYV